MKHVIRPGAAGDRGYVIKSWLQSYRGSPFARQLPDWAYWSRWGHVGVVEHHYEQGDVTVAALEDDPEFALGWAVTEPGHWLEAPGRLLPAGAGVGTVLHYLFVRHDFTRKGIGRALLEATGLGAGKLHITHVTPDFSAAFGRGREVEFVNPYRRAR